MQKAWILLLGLFIISLSIGTVQAADAATIMDAVRPYMTSQYALDASCPMIRSQEMDGHVCIYRLPTNPVIYAYTSSAAIDCDGQYDSKCDNDPTNLGETSFTQSDGKALKPAILPWYVLPETPNPYFDYAKRNISGGQLGLVIYGNKMEYGVFGDERGRDVGNSAGKAIGEVSYAMAVALGIDPDPADGGVSGGVTYLVFTQNYNRVSPIENHLAAETKGEDAVELMLSQLGSNSPPVNNTQNNTNNQTGNQTDNKICNPYSVMGCMVCNYKGSAWFDDDSRCPNSKDCHLGDCVENPVNNQTNDSGDDTPISFFEKLIDWIISILMRIRGV